jgi:hypothetical protein
LARAICAIDPRRTRMLYPGFTKKARSFEPTGYPFSQGFCGFYKEVHT